MMEMAEALIEAVRKRQVLYDREDDNYSNRAFINQNWMDVSEEAGIDEATARKKWAILRDSFRKHYRKELSFKSAAVGGKIKSHKRWYLYNSMLFLIPFIEDRINILTPNDMTDDLDTTTNTSEEDDKNLALHDIMTVNQSISSTPPPSTLKSLSADDFLKSSAEPTHNNSSTGYTGSQQSTMHTTYTTTLGRKRTYPQQVHDYNTNTTTTTSSSFDREIEILNALKQIQHQIRSETTRDLDGDEHFLLSLLPVLRSLDPVSKFECRGELNAVALSYLRRSREQSPPPHLHQQDISDPDL